MPGGASYTDRVLPSSPDPRRFGKVEKHVRGPVEGVQLKDASMSIVVGIDD